MFQILYMYLTVNQTSHKRTLLPFLIYELLSF